MWVNFNSLCKPPSLWPVCIHPYWDLKVHQLHDFSICTTWQGGNERWQLISNTWSIYCGAFFPDLNSNCYDINNMKFDLNVSDQRRIYGQWPGLIIMSRTSFRANSHSIVCLNVKQLLARSRCHIWSLAKWSSVRLRPKWLRVQILLLSQDLLV